VGIPDDSKLNRLAGITQPTLVANGDHDLFQYPAEFAAEVNGFLG
jgi:predicted alpha/beta-hydrolase family hydrolase